MSNPGNLIRPPVLQNVNQSPAPNPNPNPILAPQTEEMITALIRRVCIQEFENMVRVTADSNSNTLPDQEIFDEQRGNLADLERVPDIVKSLREFSGNSSEFSSWRKSVDRILKLYEPQRGTAKYFAILNVVRNKIVGNACSALESYNTPLNWEAISKCLTMHYADRRDLGTLEYQMSSMVQGQKNINEYYQSVYTHLSLLLNNIACMDIGQEALQVLTKTYREKALDTFVRGLNGNLPDLLGVANPKSLPEALQICLKMQNQNFRSNYAQKKFPPIIPPRRLDDRANPQHMATKQGQFYPQLAHIPKIPQNAQQTIQYTAPPYAYIPRQQQHPQQSYPLHYSYPQQPQYQQYPPPRPMGPKPLQRPEPMDVDQSIRSRAVNYMNKPQFNQHLGKGQTSDPPQYPGPKKLQRNFHIGTEPQQSITEAERQDMDNKQEIPDDEIPFDDYLEMLSKQEELFTISENGEPECIDMSEIHFLD